MVNNIKCDTCKFQPKCVGYNKLKPLTDEARVDLGITLNFVSCNDFAELDDEAEEE